MAGWADATRAERAERAEAERSEAGLCTRVSWAERHLLGRCSWEKEKGERAGLLGRGEKEKEVTGWASSWVGLLWVFCFSGFSLLFFFKHHSN